MSTTHGRFRPFGVFGDGKYRLRPLHVDDMAALMIDHADRTGNTSADAVGPEGFEYRELVRTIAKVLNIKRPVISVPPGLGYAVSTCLNPFVKDVIITREEIAGLMRGLLDSQAPAAGMTKLTQWAASHRDELGRKYASEVGRRVHRDKAYEAI